MKPIAHHSIIQAYFRSGTVFGELVQLQPVNATQTRAAGQSRRPPTYRDLTLQAHQRSSGLTGRSSGSRNAFVVPPHLAGFGRRAGQKLPSAVQQKMEAFFGADFSDVQVHSGPEANAIGALAFTQGSNIYFAPGQYNPNSHFGQQLLAHELTHVVQQRAGRVRNPFGSGIAVVQDPMLEAEAERMGRQAALHVLPAQAKMAQRHIQEQPSSVHLTGPMKVREGSYKITAQEKGRPVGSVIVHKRGRAAEVTDLGVDAGHRGRGFGEKLISSALRTGLRMGLKRVKLDVGDSGTGRLTNWYRQIGFRQTGLDQRGRPHMEAPIHKVLSGVAQGRMAPSSKAARYLKQHSRVTQLAQVSVEHKKKPESAAKKELPIYVVSRSETPNIYFFTLDAIDKGAPTVLTYVENKNSTIYALNLKTGRIETIAHMDSEEVPLADRRTVTIRDVAREKVFTLGTQLKGAKKNWEAGYSRDEYPYASTLECGTDAYWAYVPVGEQSKQGGKLASLYSKLSNYDKFKVVLAP